MIKSQEYIYLDLFSGVGGFHLGLERAGFKFGKVYFSEIDKYSIAVYKHKFKNAEYVGSVTDVSGTELRKKHPGAKFIITFGFPCQDLSLAGKGKGLSGERSGLFFEAIRIVKEVNPDIFIFENVKGLLSSNEGNDFETVLRTIADIRLYECEWQLVNTAWVLPQNRERIYFVGHLAGRSKPGVFPFRESDSEFNQKHGHTAKGEIASTLQSPENACGNYKGMNAIVQKSRGFNKGGEKEICPTISSCAFEQNNVVQIKPVLTPDRKEKRQNGRRFKNDGEPAFTLNTQDMHGVMIDMKVANCVTPDAYLTKGERKRDENGKAVLTSMHERRIRRLTEIECSRLQGFPDSWNEYGNYDDEVKKVSKTQRYKQMGNAVTVDIVEMVGKRILNNCIHATAKI